jgi:hypothetical protein
MNKAETRAEMIDPALPPAARGDSRRSFSDWEFDLIGPVELDRDPSSALLELMPQARYREAASSKLHRYGAGPFCRFRIARGRRHAGLYVLTLNDEPVYAGECANLDMRWGPNGYGGISPRNCYHGGQQTNCRINALILASAKQGGILRLWFAALDADTDSRRDAETKLIQALTPVWNRAKLRAS